MPGGGGGGGGWGGCSSRSLVTRLAARRIEGNSLDRSRVAEEAAESADYLLTMHDSRVGLHARVHIEFDDFLSALLTRRSRDPPRFQVPVRKTSAGQLRSYGTRSLSGRTPPDALASPSGRRVPPRAEALESMSAIPDEVFRLNLGEPTCAAAVSDGALQKTTDVARQPGSAHRAEDGFPLRETSPECMQPIKDRRRRLEIAGNRQSPKEMTDDQEVSLDGGRR